MKAHRRDERPVVLLRVMREGPWRSVVLVLLLLPLSGCSGSEQPVDKAEAIRQGDELSNAGQLDRAAAAYRRAVAADPRDGTARMRLARTYDYAGRWQEAAAESIRAADLLPDSLEAKLLAARLVLPMSRFQDAIQMTTQILRSQPDNAQALAIKATATARLTGTSYALFAIGPSVQSGEGLEEKYQGVRPPAGREADQAAEALFRQALALAPDDRDIAMAYANFLWATRRLDEAEPFLRRVTDAMPGHATLNHALGAYYVSRKRYADGEPYLKRAASSPAPFNQPPAKDLLNLYFDLDRRADAVALLDSLAATDTSNESALRAAGIVAEDGHVADALRRIDALSLNANDPRALKVRAQALFAAGNLSAALAAARGSVSGDGRVSGARFVLGRILAASGQPDAAFDELREALRLDPDSRAIPIVLARVALAIGRNVEALEYAREAARKQPDDEEAAAAVIKGLVRTRSMATAEREITPLLAKFPSSADLHAQLGAIRAAQERAPAARAAYDRALELNPGSLDALGGLIALDLAQRQTAAARQRIDRALARYPDEQGYLVLASRVLAAEGAATEAESALRRVLTLNPGNVDAALTLAESLSGRGQSDQAAAVLEAIVAARPLSIAAQTALATQYERMGRTADARARYQRIVQQDPGAGPAAARLALLLAATGGNLEVALGIVSAAKARAPNDPELSDALGWVQHRQGLTSIALPQFQDAVRTEPRNAAYRYHLGVAYAALGQRDQARAELTRALQLNPAGELRTQVQAAIDALRR